jgi:hypothetical protein
MNKCLLYTILISSLLFSTRVFANDTNFGIGASFNSKLNFANSTFYFPINTENYIFEPTFSFSAYNQKPGSPSTTNKITADFYSIGLGIYKKLSVAKNTIIYYGISGGYFSSTSDYSISSDSDQFKYYGFYIAPTFGTEYFLSLKFSLGIDLSVGYSMSDDNITTNINGSISNQDSKNSSLDTSTKIILRYHF